MQTSRRSAVRIRRSGSAGSPRTGPAGFSLIELVVAMTAAAVLAGIAFPAYRANVLRTHRIEARAALLALATAQEKLYLECHAYAAVLDATTPACEPPTLRLASISERGNYTLAVTHADASGWVAKATVVGSSGQAEDSACHELELTSTGARTARRSDGSSSDFECWNR
jgi:type IV pilus assembly protein PilE